MLVAALLMPIPEAEAVEAEVSQAGSGAAPGAVEAASERLRIRIEQSALDVGEETIYTREELPRFYDRRSYRVAWLHDGRPLPVARQLFDILQSAADEGLRPEDYRVHSIEALLDRVTAGPGPSEGERVDLDLLLTDAFLVQAAHLVSGRLDPETFHPEWLAVRREVNLVPVLEGALAGGDIRGAFAALLPVHPEYAPLKGALSQYRAAAAGRWPPVPDGPTLRKGDAGERVDALRRRLAASGDLKEPAGIDFDDAVEAGVVRFQARHGLQADGVAGARTLAALNVGVESRVRQSN